MLKTIGSAAREQIQKLIAKGLSRIICKSATKMAAVPHPFS